jgi:hypothetical protein
VLALRLGQRQLDVGRDVPDPHRRQLLRQRGLRFGREFDDIPLRRAQRLERRGRDEQDVGGFDLRHDAAGVAGLEEPVLQDPARAVEERHVERRARVPRLELHKALAGPGEERALAVGGGRERGDHPLALPLLRDDLDVEALPLERDDAAGGAGRNGTSGVAGGEDEQEPERGKSPDHG